MAIRSNWPLSRWRQAGIGPVLGFSGIGGGNGINSPQAFRKANSALPGAQDVVPGFKWINWQSNVSLAVSGLTVGSTSAAASNGAVAVGDLLFAVVIVEGVSGATTNFGTIALAGSWTNAYNDFNSNYFAFNVAIFWKVATSADVTANTYAATWTGTSVVTNWALLNYGQAAGTPIDVSVSNTFAAATTFATSTLSPTVAGDLVLHFYVAAISANSPYGLDAGLVPRSTISYGNSIPALLIGDKQLSGTPGVSFTDTAQYSIAASIYSFGLQLAAGTPPGASSPILRPIARTAFFGALGGTAYFVTALGASASVAGLVRGPALQRLGASASAAALVRATGVTRAGLSAGVAGLARQAGLLRGGASAAVASMSESKVKLVSALASSSSAAGLTRQVAVIRNASSAASAGLARAIGVTRTGTGAAVASLVRQVGLVRAGASAAVASMAESKVKLVSAPASSATVASLVRQVAVTRAASSAALAGLVRAIGATRMGASAALASLVRQTILARAGASAAVASLTTNKFKQVIALAASASIAGLARQASLPRAGASAAAASAARGIGKPLAAASAALAAMSENKVKLVSAQAISASLAALARQVALTRQGSSAALAGLVRAIGATKASASSAAASLARQAGLVRRGASAAGATLAASKFKQVTAAAISAAVAGLVRQVALTRSSASAPLAGLARLVAVTRTGSSATAGTLARQIRLVRDAAAAGVAALAVNKFRSSALLSAVTIVLPASAAAALLWSPRSRRRRLDVPAFTGPGERAAYATPVALAWPSHPAGQVLDYALVFRGEDAVRSVLAASSDAALAIVGQQLAGDVLTLWLSGGVAGAVYEIDLTVATQLRAYPLAVQIVAV